MCYRYHLLLHAKRKYNNSLAEIQVEPVVEFRLLGHTSFFINRLHLFEFHTRKKKMHISIIISITEQFPGLYKTNISFTFNTNNVNVIAFPD